MPNKSPNTGSEELDHDLTLLMDALSDENLKMVKKALADSTISPADFQKIIPIDAIRLASFLLNDELFNQLAETIAPVPPTSLEWARDLIKKHVPELLSHPAAAASFKEAVQRLAKTQREDTGITNLTAVQSEFSWIGNVPKLSPTVKIRLLSEEQKLFETSIRLKELVFLTGALSSVLVQMIEQNVTMSGHKLLHISDPKAIGTLLAKAKADLDAAVVLAPKLGIAVPPMDPKK